MSPRSSRCTQGVGLIGLGVVVIVVAVLVWVSEAHRDTYIASKEPFIAILGVLAIVGGIMRLVGKAGNR